MDKPEEMQRLSKIIKRAMVSSPGHPGGVDAASELLAGVIVEIRSAAESLESLATSVRASQHQMAIIASMMKRQYEEK